MGKPCNFYSTRKQGSTDAKSGSDERRCVKYIITLLNYYSGADVDRASIEGIRKEMMRLGMDTSWKNQTPLGDKYRVLWAMADSRENSATDRENFRYGVSTAFGSINRNDDQDQVLIDLIRESAKQEDANLYEPPVPRPQGGQLT